MAEKACEHNHKVYTNPGAATKAVTIVFHQLCGSPKGVQCSHVDASGNPVEDDKFANNPGDVVVFDVKQFEGVTIFCNGGDHPTCMYDLEIA